MLKKLFFGLILFLNTFAQNPYVGEKQ